MAFRGDSSSRRSRGQCFGIFQEFISLRAGERGSPGKRAREGRRKKLCTRRAGIDLRKSFRQYPRESGNESFRRRGARCLHGGNSETLPRANRERTVPGAGRSGCSQRRKAKMGLFPRPRAARSAADGAQPPAAPPKAGDAFRGGVEPSVPMVRNLPGGKHSAPPTTPREMRPARPAGGGVTHFANFPGYTRSARHWNLLRGTLNSAVLHVNFPGLTARHKDSSVMCFRQSVFM